MSENKEGPRWFEILNIDTEKNQLVLTKKSGTWRLDIKPGMIKESAMAELLARKKEGGWAMLGIAFFGRDENGKLHLDHIGL